MPGHSRQHSWECRAAGVPIAVGCGRPASVLGRAAAVPATDTKSGVSEKGGRDPAPTESLPAPHGEVSLERNFGGVPLTVKNEGINAITILKVETE